MRRLFDTSLALQPRPFLSQPLLDHVFELGHGNERGVTVSSGLMAGFPRQSLSSFYRWCGVRHMGSLLSA
jgi:hypothetical protein